jgi:outer membrane lipoprotein SlyB
MNKTVTIFIALCALGLAGCAGPQQSAGPILPNAPAHSRQSVTEYGRLLSAEVVTVQGLPTGGGLGAGAALGAGLGNAVTSGGARFGGTIIGLVAGAVAGNETEKRLEKHKAMRYTVLKDAGGRAEITQRLAKNEAPLKTGRRVMIRLSDGEIRVLPAAR